MSGFARIESIEALKELRTFLSTLKNKISVAIDEAEYEITRTLNHLRMELNPYWQKELRVRREELVVAKLTLKSKMAFKNTAVDGYQSFLDEKKALAIAQRRFEEAEDKIRKIRAFIPELEKEGYNCRGVLQTLSSLVHVDIPNRRTQIEQMICSLESYVNLAAPVGMGVPSDSESTSAEMAQAISTEISDLEQLCKKLRQKNPLQSITSHFSDRKPALDLFENLIVSKEISEKLKEVTKNTPSFSKGDKLAFDHLIETSKSIYIEPATAIADREIKLYIGTADLNSAAGKYSTCTIADFLKEYPALGDILSLPEGWLAVLEDNTVKAIFDDEDKLV